MEHRFKWFFQNIREVQRFICVICVQILILKQHVENKINCHLKAVRVYNLNDIRIEETAVPEIGPDEALVRMKTCGICGSDTMDWYVAKKAPLWLGHEPAGIIEKVGRNVAKFNTGDRVFVHHHAPCFDCKYCQKQQYSLCPAWKATNLDPGGMAEYFRVPAINLQGDTLKLPDTFSFEDGALIEPTACVVKSFKRAGFQTGDSMLIIGLGVMGQMHILLGRHYGASMIIGADRVPYRLQKARELGADAVVDVSSENLQEQVADITTGKMADIVVVGPHSTEAMQTGLACAGKGGTVLFFTPSPEGAQLNIHPFHLYFNEIDLIFSYSCGPDDTRAAMNLIEQEVVTAKDLVTHRFPLHEAQQAVAKTVEANASLKTLVVCE